MKSRGYKERKSAQLNVRFFPNEKIALERAAAEDDRPAAELIRKIVRVHLRAAGFLQEAAR